MNYYFFLDETGNHGLTYIDAKFPVFLLCGCIIREDSLVELEKQVNAFKLKYFNTTEVILHSREIRKCEGAFQILFDLDIKAEFYKDLNKILGEGKYCLLSSAIHKEKYIRVYGKGATDPYSLSLSFVLERLVFYMDRADRQGTVKLLVEKRGKKEDTLLYSHYCSLLARGSGYVESDRMKGRIKKISFHDKKKNIIGLQIADLCAYPLARHVLSPREPYIPFGVIEKKIYAKREGQYMGWGMKVFP
jgi:hypothetical protein